MDTKLQQLVEQARARVMTNEERDEQRVGFAFGNAPEDDRNTKESVREIARAQRSLTQKA